MHNGGDTADSADNAAPTTDSHALFGDSELADDTIEDYDAAIDEFQAICDLAPDYLRPALPAIESARLGRLRRRHQNNPHPL